MYWNILVIALCLLLLLFLIGKEIKRLNKSSLIARLFASFFAIASLACLALPFTTTQKVSTYTSAESILLTEGFNQDSVQKIINANKVAKIFTTIKSNPSFNATYINDLTFFKDLSPNTTLIHIFGYGLDKNELGHLKNTPALFYPAAVKNSITAFDHTQKLTAGEPLIVQGSFNNATFLPAKIILSGFSTNLDSMVLAANRTAYFQLTTTVKHVDKAVYSLTVLSGKDTIEKEPIPVEVKIAYPFSILILAGSPDFENKFLIAWLAKHNYKFAIRTRISKNKYEKQYINIAAVNVDHITTSLLDKFDVILADASELSALPAADVLAIKNNVDSKGIGLIVRADSADNSSAFYLQSFPLVETKDSLQHNLTLFLSDTNFKASPLRIEQPLYIRYVAGTQPLVKDQLERTMVNSKLYGLGKVVLSTIQNTYTWQLSGNNNDYNNYWSWLLQKAAKKMPLSEIWNVRPALPQKNEAVNLKLQTAKAIIPHAQTAGEAIHMEQNYLLPYEWYAAYWPIKTGWQSLSEGGGAIYWWYVYDIKDWKGIKAQDKINATKMYAAHHPYAPSNAFTEKAKTRIEIPKIYFFILFILCAGFLWFEKKFKDRS